MMKQVQTTPQPLENETQSEAAKSELPPATRPPKVAYVMSRFPKITETFILFEMLALEQQGVQVEVYPIRREKTSVMHPEAEAFVARAHFQPFLSWPILRAHLYFLGIKPWRKERFSRYLSTLWTLLRANWGSRRYLIGALGLFPKAVYFAQHMAAAEITHVHACWASHAAAVGFVVRRLAGIPYSFAAHGSDLHRDRHMLREKVAEAAFVVPISDYNRDIILSECGGHYGDKVQVIHCGINTQVFHPRTKPTPYEEGRAPFTILCIGTLHEVKGQTYLIEACRLLRERGIEFLCHFIGDGPDREMLAEQARQADLVAQVRFHGRLTQAEIAGLLQGADVVATPSVPTSDGRREGIPVVLMEAMGSGVPVVASDLSGIPELVIDGQTGLLVAPRDARGLAEALARLYSDPALRQRLGRAGREKVVTEFDLHKNAAKLAQCFSQMA